MSRARTIEIRNMIVRKADLLTMFVVQGSLDIINRRVGHATSLKDIKPFLGSLLNSGTFNHGIDLRPVLYSVAICNESSIRLPLGKAQSITQHAKKLVITTAKQDVSILGLVAAVGHNRC